MSTLVVGAGAWILELPDIRSLSMTNNECCLLQFRVWLPLYVWCPYNGWYIYTWVNEFTSSAFVEINSLGIIFSFPWAILLLLSKVCFLFLSGYSSISNVVSVISIIVIPHAQNSLSSYLSSSPQSGLYFCSSHFSFVWFPQTYLLCLLWVLYCVYSSSIISETDFISVFYFP